MVELESFYHLLSPWQYNRRLELLLTMATYDIGESVTWYNMVYSDEIRVTKPE